MKLPVLVTNKHVISGATVGYLRLTAVGANGLPAFGTVLTLRITDFDKMWIEHPDPQVDLAVYPIGSLLEEAYKNSPHKPFTVSLPPARDPNRNAVQYAHTDRRFANCGVSERDFRCC